jgi:hypothetical protein
MALHDSGVIYMALYVNVEAIFNKCVCEIEIQSGPHADSW